MEYQTGVDTPFNRTSMESKLSGMQDLVNDIILLIEPVWNRNREGAGIVTGVI